MQDNQNLITADLQVDSIAYAHLKETAMWSKFLGITGFIISALYVLIAIFVGSFFENYVPKQSMALMGGTGAITALYLVVAAIGFVVSLFMFRFAGSMKAALQNSDQESLNKAFLNLKLVYRFYGIVMIIALAFMVLAFIVGIGAALFAGR